MKEKKIEKVTQAEIDLAKEEYFKNGGVVTVLTTQGSHSKNKTNERRQDISRREGT